MYLSITPLCARIGSDISAKYSLIKPTKPAGLSSSASAVKATRSEKYTVTTCFSPLSAWSGRPLIRFSTMRGSTYWPKVCLIRCLWRYSDMCVPMRAMAMAGLTGLVM